MHGYIVFVSLFQSKLNEGVDVDIILVSIIAYVNLSCTSHKTEKSSPFCDNYCEVAYKSAIFAANFPPADTLLHAWKDEPQSQEQNVIQARLPSRQGSPDLCF